MHGTNIKLLSSIVYVRHLSSLAAFPKPGLPRTSLGVPLEILKHEKLQISFEIFQEFSPAVGITGVISVRYQLILCFVSVLKDGGSS
jgi:hypothetical protein